MNTKLFLLASAITCFASSASFAMTSVEHKTQKDAISGDYKVSRDKCNSLKANAKDICVSEAKGVQKIAKAELKSAYEPSARHTQQVAMAKGDAAYDTAKEKCDDSQGNAKTICRADAKAAHVKASDEARVMRVGAETDKLNTGVRKMATKDENEASFKAATARCDNMTGAAKDVCITEAKVKYNMN
jgi:hypothetical protein